MFVGLLVSSLSRNDWSKGDFIWIISIIGDVALSAAGQTRAVATGGALGVALAGPPPGGGHDQYTIGLA